MTIAFQQLENPPVLAQYVVRQATLLCKQWDNINSRLHKALAVTTSIPLRSILAAVLKVLKVLLPELHSPSSLYLKLFAAQTLSDWVQHLAPCVISVNVAVFLAHSQAACTAGCCRPCLWARCSSQQSTQPDCRAGQTSSQQPSATLQRPAVCCCCGLRHTCSWLTVRYPDNILNHNMLVSWASLGLLAKLSEKRCQKQQELQQGCCRLHLTRKACATQVSTLPAQPPQAVAAAVMFAAATVVNLQDVYYIAYTKGQLQAEAAGVSAD